MAYDTVKDKLSSISWNLKRIADSLDDLVELEHQKQPRITAKEFFKNIQTDK